MKGNISIVVPGYNEEENIKTYDKLLIPEIKYLKNFEIIIVNDGSTDNTLEEAKKLMKKHKFVSLVSYEKNMGMGYAMKQGFKKTKYENTVVLDSDLTFHPRYIKDLLEAKNKTNADCVVGSHLMMEHGAENVPLFRLMLHKSINYFYYILFNRKVYTISSIFRLYNTKDLKEINIESNGFNINAEILFKLIQKKKKIVEVPAKLTKRVYGESKINLMKEAKNHIILILKIFRWKLVG